MEIITSHVHLDLDGLASMILAKKLHPNAVLVLPGDISDNLKELINFYKEELEFFRSSEIKVKDITKLIIVDTSNKSRLGKFSEVHCETIVYDHHNSLTFGSNSTLLLQEVFSKNLLLTKLETSIALMGIYEDTGNFTFKNTTHYDMEAGAKLLKSGANLEMVMRYVTKSLTQRELELVKTLMNNGSIFEINHQKIFISITESAEYLNGLDVLINKILELEGSDACFIIHGDGNKNSIIGRSVSKKIHINKILEIFSYGGHQYASSTVVKNLSVENIKKILLEQLEKTIDIGKLAKHIMKSPVKTIESNFLLKDLNKLMNRFSYSGMPIADKGKLVGIISRRDVEKAVSHGFGNAPVSSYMTKTLIIGKPNDDLETIKELFVKNEISRVPIVDENQNIIGLITRSNLLEELYNDTFYELNSKNNNNDFFTQKINLLPKSCIDIFEKISIISSRNNVKAYLVGGIVRDLILGIPNLDIDIVIEGNAIDFGEAYAKEYPVKKIIKHETFKTCILILNDNQNIDIASSRVEYYEYPTSLPTVEFSDIKEDLYRRDFTMNAMAISIQKENFGFLLDYCGGFSDLKNKKIKVLHNLSFIEDPTRIIRAIRFAVRYNFDFEENTLKLMLDAITNGFLNNLSWQRFRNELEIMFKEDNFMNAIEYLENFGILKRIHPSIQLNDRIRNHLKITYSFKSFFSSNNIELWLIHLLVLLEDLDKKSLNFIFTRFSFSKTFIEKYNYGKNIRNHLAQDLKVLIKNSDIFQLLTKIPKEIVCLIYAENVEVRDKIDNYLYNLAEIKPKIGGLDLINEGFSPNEKFKNYLSEIFKIQLDNQNLNKKELMEKWKKREM